MVGVEVASTMGTGSLGRELDLRPLVDELADSIENQLEANFTSEGMVTVYLDGDSPAYTLYRTGAFQIRGAEAEADLSRAESRLRAMLLEIGVEIPDYESLGGWSSDNAIEPYLAAPTEHNIITSMSRVDL